MTTQHEQARTLALGRLKGPTTSMDTHLSHTHPRTPRQPKEGERQLDRKLLFPTRTATAVMLLCIGLLSPVYAQVPPPELGEYDVLLFDHPSENPRGTLELVVVGRSRLSALFRLATSDAEVRLNGRWRRTLSNSVAVMDMRAPDTDQQDAGGLRLVGVVISVGDEKEVSVIRGHWFEESIGGRLDGAFQARKR